MKTALTTCLAAALLVAAARAAEPAPAAKHKPNPKLAAMKPHSWLRIGGAPPAPRGIMAYSGGVFDSEHNVFLVFGGGHADYWGNEVCAFNLKTLTWKKMYQPDAAARYTNDNIDNQKGKLKDSDKPYTRHSYQMLAFVPSVKKMFIWSGCGPGWGRIAPTCPSPRDAWYYDYAANKWELLTTGGPGGYGGGTCFDSKRNCIWALPGTSWPKLWKFDVKTGKWSRHAMKPESSAGVHLNLVYNAKRDVIFAGIGNDGKRSYLIHPNTIKVEKVDTRRYTPGGYGGLALLPDQDAAVSLKNGPTMGVFDFGGKRWLPLPPLEGTPKLMGYAVYGRFDYSPVDKAVVFVGRAGTYAYKPPEKYDFPALAKAAEAAAKK